MSYLLDTQKTRLSLEKKYNLNSQENAKNNINIVPLNQDQKKYTPFSSAQNFTLNTNNNAIDNKIEISKQNPQQNHIQLQTTNINLNNAQYDTKPTHNITNNHTEFEHKIIDNKFQANIKKIEKIIDHTQIKSSSDFQEYNMRENIQHEIIKSPFKTNNLQNLDIQTKIMSKFDSQLSESKKKREDLEKVLQESQKKLEEIDIHIKKTASIQKEQSNSPKNNTKIFKYNDNILDNNKLQTNNKIVSDFTTTTTNTNNNTINIKSPNQLHLPINNDLKKSLDNIQHLKEKYNIKTELPIKLNSNQNLDHIKPENNASHIRRQSYSSSPIKDEHLNNSNNNHKYGLSKGMSKEDLINDIIKQTKERKNPTNLTTKQPEHTKKKSDTHIKELLNKYSPVKKEKINFQYKQPQIDYSKLKTDLPSLQQQQQQQQTNSNYQSPYTSQIPQERHSLNIHDSQTKTKTQKQSQELNNNYACKYQPDLLNTEQKKEKVDEIIGQYKQLDQNNNPQQNYSPIKEKKTSSPQVIEPRDQQQFNYINSPKRNSLHQLDKKNEALHHPEKHQKITLVQKNDYIHTNQHQHQQNNQLRSSLQHHPLQTTIQINTAPTTNNINININNNKGSNGSLTNIANEPDFKGITMTSVTSINVDKMGQSNHSNSNKTKQPQIQIRPINQDLKELKNKEQSKDNFYNNNNTINNNGANTQYNDYFTKSPPNNTTSLNNNFFTSSNNNTNSSQNNNSRIVVKEINQKIDSKQNIQNDDYELEKIKKSTPQTHIQIYEQQVQKMASSFQSPKNSTANNSYQIKIQQSTSDQKSQYQETDYIKETKPNYLQNPSSQHTNSSYMNSSYDNTSIRKDNSISHILLQKSNEKSTNMNNSRISSYTANNINNNNSSKNSYISNKQTTPITDPLKNKVPSLQLNQIQIQIDKQNISKQDLHPIQTQIQASPSKKITEIYANKPSTNNADKNNNAMAYYNNKYLYKKEETKVYYQPSQASTNTNNILDNTNKESPAKQPTSTIHIQYNTQQQPKEITSTTTTLPQKQEKKEPVQTSIQINNNNLEKITYQSPQKNQFQHQPLETKKEQQQEQQTHKIKTAIEINPTPSENQDNNNEKSTRKSGGKYQLKLSPQRSKDNNVSNNTNNNNNSILIQQSQKKMFKPLSGDNKFGRQSTLITESGIKTARSIRYSPLTTRAQLQQSLLGQDNNNNEQNNNINVGISQFMTQSNRMSSSQVLKTCRSMSTFNPCQVSLKDFTIIKRIGKGKFASVYLAIFNQTGFLVAVKIIQKMLIIAYEMEQMLIDEIKIQSHLQHPNIIDLYGVFDDEENIYLIQEYADGGNLYEEMKTFNQKRFAESYASQVMYQVLKAVQYLHSKKIIHRDIKPENLLLFQKTIKIADFGCSVYSKDEKELIHCGTLDYLPPEMAKNQCYGHQVDLWALGILTYELITGKPPFANIKDEQEVYQQIRNGEIRYNSQIVSLQAQDFIKKLCQKKPKDRMSLEKALNHQFITQHNNTQNNLDTQCQYNQQKQAEIENIVNNLLQN